MSVFNAPIIKLEDDKMNCPTKVYNWIKIVEYKSNDESDYYLCIDKRVLNKSIFLIKYRNIMKLELPPSNITTNDKILNYVIIRLVHESTLDNIRDIDYIKNNFAENYHLFKIIETNNFLSKYNGKIQINISDFEKVDLWNDFTENDNGLYVYNFYTKPPLFKRKQNTFNEKFINIRPLKLLSPLYTDPQKKIYYNDQYSKDAFFKFDLLIPPLSNIKLNLDTNISSQNETGVDNGEIKIEIQNINRDFFTIDNGIVNTDNIVINNMDLNMFDDDIQDIKIWLPYTIINKGSSKLYINWNIETDDVLYKDISGTISLSIIYFNLKLNYSNSSFQTNLMISDFNNIHTFIDVSNNLIPSCLGQFNSIVMNKDSDNEYLIFENKPYSDILNETFLLEFTSTNENVLKSFSKEVVSRNTSEVLRLQRFGDPRDYVNSFSLVKLKCINSGITKLFVKVVNKITNISIHLKPFYLCSISLNIDKSFEFINTTSNTLEEVKIKPICMGNNKIIKYLFNQNNFNVYNKLKSKQKQIPNERIFNKLILEYLDKKSLNPETDISIHFDTNLNENVSFDVHNIVEKLDNTDGDIDILNKQNISDENGAVFDLRGIRPGKIEIKFLINSLMRLTNYLKQTETFSRNRNEIESEDIFIKNIWPQKNIERENKRFNKGIDSENKYKFTNLLDDTHYLCNTSTYGQDSESIYDREFVYKTKLTEIIDIENWVLEKDDGEKGTCILNFGKKNKGIWDKNYWSKQNLKFDFYIRSVPINTNKFARKNPEFKAIFTPTIYFRSKDIKNTIKRLYYENEQLYMYFDISGNFDDFSTMGGKSIKLKNFRQELIFLNDALFFVEKAIGISETLYMFVLSTVKNIDIKNIQFQNVDKKNIYWIKDDTQEINAEFKLDLVNKQIMLKNIKDEKTKLIEEIDDFSISLNRDEQIYNDRILSLLNIVEPTQLTNIKNLFRTLKQNILETNETEVKKLNSNYLIFNNEVSNLIDTYNLEWKKKVIDIDAYKSNHSKYFQDISFNMIETRKKLENFKTEFIFIGQKINEINELELEYFNQQKNLNTIEILSENMDDVEKEYIWLSSPIKDDIINTPEIPKKWFISKERYVITLKTIVYKNDSTEVYEYDTNLTEINNVDLFIKSLEGKQNNEAVILQKNINGIVKEISNLENVKKNLSGEKDQVERSTLIDLDIANKQIDILKLKEKYDELIKLGSGGLSYVKYVDDKWFYLWKEWRIDYIVYNRPKNNFNEIIKYYTNGSALENKNLSIYCSGKQYLTIDELSGEYSVLKSKIKLNNINTIYDIETIFTVVSIEEYGSDNYILNIKPDGIFSLSDEISIFQNVSYWSIYKKNEISIQTIATTTDNYEIVKNKCVLKRDEALDDEKKDGVVSNVVEKISYNPNENIGIHWATSINNEVVYLINDLSNVKFKVEDDMNFVLEIYSKIKSDFKPESTIDNYYKYSRFPNIPNAEFDKTTYSIYTNGASNTKHMYNTQPCPEFFYCSKIPSLSFDVITVEIPFNISININRNYNVQLVWLPKRFDYKFDLYKYENTSDNPKWELIDTVDNNFYIDTNVSKYNTYSYKIKSILNYKNKVAESPFSEVISIFVCGDKKFELGRYNVKLDLNRNLDCNSNARPLNLFSETKKQMTQRQIFAFLAKKKGGGIFR